MADNTTPAPVNDLRTVASELALEERAEIRSREGTPLLPFDDEAAIGPDPDDSINVSSTVVSNKLEVPLFDYICHVMRFLQGLMGNSHHAEVTKGLLEGHLLEQLLGILQIPNLPVSFNRSTAAEELRGVFSFLTEQAHETIIPVSVAFASSLQSPVVQDFMKHVFEADATAMASFTEDSPAIRALSTIERLSEVFALGVREGVNQGFVDQISVLVVEGKENFQQLAFVKRGLLFAIRLATRMLNSVVPPTGTGADRSGDQSNLPSFPLGPITSQLPDVNVASLIPKAQCEPFSRLVETLASVYRSVTAVVSQFGRVFQRRTFDASSDAEKMLHIVVGSFTEAFEVALASAPQSTTKTAVIVWADYVAATVAEVQAFMFPPSTMSRAGSERQAINPMILKALDKCDVFQV